MKNLTQTMMLVLFSLVAQNCLANQSMNQAAGDTDNRYELKSVQQQDTLFLNHSFLATKSGDFLNLSTRTEFDAKKLRKPTTEISLSTNSGTLIITKKGLMTMIDGHNEFISADEQEMQKLVFQSLVSADLIEAMQQEIKLYAGSVNRGGACGAATSGAAHAVGEYAYALFSGDFDGANFWFSVYQGHVYNMRIFCEIE